MHPLGIPERKLLAGEQFERLRAGVHESRFPSRDRAIALSLRRYFRNANDSTRVVATLRELAASHELQAAHRAEYITDHTPAAKEADPALDAATHHGIAIGLNTAADLLST